jgi:catechol 2,3-dioxygenase
MKKLTSKKQSSLAMGKVSLHVRNLSTMKDFYHKVIGLELISESNKKVVLGHEARALVELHEDQTLPEAQPGHAGLYHLALLFQTQGELARRVAHILSTARSAFIGSADHLVSEAFYFTDPEGNGIELYFDRERDQWNWENGQIQMASIYIDPISYSRMFAGLGMDQQGVSMGHVHLKVGDIEKARGFYVDILGFDQTALLPGALFVSKDGYHHHIGMNSWESEGALERILSSGLKSFHIEVSPKELAVFKKRLEKHAIPFEMEDEELIFHDPWKNQIRLLAQ